MKRQLLTQALLNGQVVLKLACILLGFTFQTFGAAFAEIENRYVAVQVATFGNTSNADLYPAEDKLFIVRHGAIGPSLWVIHGDLNLPRKLANLVHPYDSYGSVPYEFHVMNGALFFNNGDQLWRSDGTIDGTSHFLSNPEGGWLSPHYFTRIGDSLFFLDHQHRIWKTDGSQAGTRILMSFGSDHASFASVSGLKAIRGKLYFAVSHEDELGGLWVSDGSTDGTRLIKPLKWVSDITEFNESTYFIGRKQPDEKMGLWRTNRSNTDAVEVQHFASSGIEIFAATNSRLYLMIADPDNQTGFAQTKRLWVSSGEAADARVIKYLGSRNYSPYFLGILNEVVYFSPYFHEKDQRELWRSNGTAAGTFQLKEINQTLHNGYPRDSAPNSLNNAENSEVLFFTADDGIHGRELWQTNGRAADTKMTADLVFNHNTPSYYNRHAFSEYRETFYFFSSDAKYDRTKLWRIQAVDPVDILPGLELIAE